MTKKCWICGKNNLEELKLSSDFYFCQDCSTLRIKKIPKAPYGKSYYKGSFSIGSLIFAPIAYIFYQLRNNYINLDSVKCWVDIGAGEGGYLKSVKASRKIGVEISEAGRKIMKLYGLEAISNEKFLRSKKINANIISFWHVLEHVENPWDYLKAANRNLAGGGEIVIGIPNVDSFEFSLFGKFWFHLAPKYHIWHYSPKSISILLNKNGFKVYSIDYWAIEHHLSGLIQSFLNRSTNTSDILHKLIKRGTERVSISFKTALWILFWFTFGFPIILLFWVIQALFRKSGAVVLVANKVR